ncbi:MAG: hydantoinase/oxoprolinase family protein [Dehalococcoidales bacterium]|nr:hydantoinase/oxoprolinase family protein [Dehalococcoidales bacterium]
MKFIIDIDNGGTFTDGFFTGDGRIEWVKVDTTPHDLSVCFLKCIEDGAKKFGVTVPQLLHETEVIRFSTTHATNTLIQRAGPRLGLIVTRDFEKSLYSSTAESPALNFIIPSEMVVGIDAKTGKNNLDIEQVRLAIRSLLGRGARIIVASLHGAHIDPTNELKIRQIADDDYPKHYLGAVPLLLSSEVSTADDDASRTNAALLNAYFHPDMVRFLYKAEDDVRNIGYRKPLLVVHSDSGVSRVAKTTAIMTYNSGPSAGVLGTTFMSKMYNLPYMVSMDIGGTSADFGLVIDGRHGYKRKTIVEGIPVKLPAIEVYPAAAGGGSIARPKNKKRVQVGPDSAGAIPGPACYGLGGMEATATDACVILGYIDPDYFLGGTRRLDAGIAREVIEKNVAEPMGLPVEKCGRLITEALEDICADGISNLIKEKGYDPGDFVLFSFGGAGGLYCCGVADKVGIPRVYCSQFSSVFSAFGSSCADVLHSYESLSKISIKRRSGQSQIQEFNETVKRLTNSALRDMRGEGFPPDKVSLSLELELKSDTTSIVLECPASIIQGQKDINKILDAFARQNDGVTVDELEILNIRLRATSPAAHPELPLYEPVGKNPEEAFKGHRDVYWKDGYLQTAIYGQSRLECGNVISGPAIIESDDTTILIPKGKKYTVDTLLSGVIESA